MTFTCPVCGYDRMPFPPEDHHICSCCGTEFGYEDIRRTHEELREEWLSRGAPWFSNAVRPPHGWDPIQQLQRAGLEFHAAKGKPVKR